MSSASTTWEDTPSPNMLRNLREAHLDTSDVSYAHDARTRARLSHGLRRLMFTVSMPDMAM